MSETRPPDIDRAAAPAEQTPTAPAAPSEAPPAAPTIAPASAPAAPQTPARKLWRIRWGFLSPRGLLVRAALLVGVYTLFHVLGWREHVSAVYATSGARTGPAVAGVLYALSYFGVVLVAPILAVAAGILAMLQRVFARRA